MLQLAKNGLIPKRLLRIEPPLCVACIHGKATKKPLCTKANPSRMPRIVTSPGECVSIDQMESSTAGLIGQLKGAILTTLRYKYATVLVDLYSDYTYVYLHARITSEEILKAKKAFEAHAEFFRVKIRQYHADNGDFKISPLNPIVYNKGKNLHFVE
jgi:hypothetical protein